MSFEQNAKISAEAQSLSTQNLVELFEIDLSRYGLGTGYFAGDVAEDGKPIRWGGKAYMPMPMEATGFSCSTEGAASRPTITMSNINSVMSGMVVAGADLVGCEVRRYITFKQFLDDGPDPDRSAHFPAEIWRINRKTAQNNLTITWELASVFDQEGVMLPKRQVLRDYCMRAYRFWDEARQDWQVDKCDPCPYAAAKCFNTNGEICGREEDRCGKRVRDCELRFGKNMTLPGYFFPGVGRVK